MTLRAELVELFGEVSLLAAERERAELVELYAADATRWRALAAAVSAMRAAPPARRPELVATFAPPLRHALALALVDRRFLADVAGAAVARPPGAA